MNTTSNNFIFENPYLKPARVGVRDKSLHLVRFQQDCGQDTADWCVTGTQFKKFARKHTGVTDLINELSGRYG